MTASFSLRFKLKVYSFKMCHQGRLVRQPYARHIAATNCSGTFKFFGSGIAICVGFSD